TVSGIKPLPPAPSPPVATQPVAPPPARVATPPPSARAADVAIAIDQAPRKPEAPLLTLDDVSEPALGLSSDKSTLVDLDQRPAATRLPATAPLESLPLHAFLGGRKSAQFNLDMIAPAEESPAAYEIALDEDEDMSLADAVAIDVPEPEAPPPNMRPLPVS